MRPEPPICGACGSTRTKLIAPITLYIQGSTVEDAVWKCAGCGTWIRAVDFDDPCVSSHFEVASFTKPESEENFRRLRGEFFRRLVRLGAHHADRPITQLRLLDVGSSYGHLLEGAKADGVGLAEGIERVKRLRERLRSRGYAVYESAAGVPDEQQYDLITLIDCLYCFEHPRPLLEELRTHLAPGGVMVVRVTNKTHLLNLAHRLGVRITSSLVCGDAKHNFTPKGLRALLENSGLRISHITGHEPGKRLPTLPMAILHHLLYGLSVITRVRVSLGLVVLARALSDTPVLLQTKEKGAVTAP